MVGRTAPAIAPEATGPAPLTLRITIGLVLAEALVMVGLLIYIVYADFSKAASSGGSALLVTLYAITMAIAFGGLGWALHRRRGWARSPTIVLQLLLLPIGWSMAGSGMVLLGVLVIVAGVIGAGALLAPTTRAALGLE